MLVQAMACWSMCCDASTYRGLPESQWGGWRMGGGWRAGDRQGRVAWAKTAQQDARDNLHYHTHVAAPRDTERAYFDDGCSGDVQVVVITWLRHLDGGVAGWMETCGGRRTWFVIRNWCWRCKIRLRQARMPYRRVLRLTFSPHKCGFNAQLMWMHLYGANI